MATVGQVPLHHGLHVWLTEELGFVHDSADDVYYHPTRDVRVNGEAIRFATADMLDPDDARALIAQLYFENEPTDG